MTHPDGYNELRWDCDERGCFNVKRRPKIEQFSPFLPGKIGFGDVDGIVEVRQHFLLLEWKGDQRRNLPRGQQILYERLTLDTRFCVLVVSGNAETMQVSAFSYFRSGKQSHWIDADFARIGRFIQRWSEAMQREKAA